MSGYQQPYPRRSGATAARRFAGMLLAVIGAVLALVALASHFAHNDLLDTDRYVANVAPLVDDPTVQAEISREVSDRIVAEADLEALGPLIEGGAENVVRDLVRSAVASNEFAELWTEANRLAHRDFVAVVTGEADDGERGGTVVIPLGELLATVDDPFADLGVSLPDLLEGVEVEVVVISPEGVALARQWVPLLDPVAGAAPWLALAAWVGALLITPKGSRAGILAGIGLGATVTGAAALLAADLARSRYLDTLPPDGLPPAAAASIYDALVEPLQSRAWVLLIAGAAIAVVGFIASLLRPRRLTPR